MKQNKDREEFKKQCENIELLHRVPIDLPKEVVDKLWSWIETHTQKKVEEEREQIIKGIKKQLPKLLEGKNSEFCEGYNNAIIDINLKAF